MQVGILYTAPSVLWIAYTTYYHQINLTKETPYVFTIGVSLGFSDSISLVDNLTGACVFREPGNFRSGPSLRHVILFMVNRTGVFDLKIDVDVSSLFKNLTGGIGIARVPRYETDTLGIPLAWGELPTDPFIIGYIVESNSSPQYIVSEPVFYICESSLTDNGGGYANSLFGIFAYHLNTGEKLSFCSSGMWFFYTEGTNLPLLTISTSNIILLILLASTVLLIYICIIVMRGNYKNQLNKSSRFIQKHHWMLGLGAGISIGAIINVILGFSWEIGYYVMTSTYYISNFLLSTLFLISIPGILPVGLVLGWLFRNKYKDKVSCIEISTLNNSKNTYDLPGGDLLGVLHQDH